MGFPLQAIHVPKTIDLPFTDNCPGFGSVAKYVALSTQEAAMDIASMCATSTKVFILEVMGRTQVGSQAPPTARNKATHRTYFVSR